MKSKCCGAESAFWEKWFILYEKGRVPAQERLLETLPCFKKHDGLFWADGMTPSLLNSYLEDLVNFIISEKYKKSYAPEKA